MNCCIHEAFQSTAAVYVHIVIYQYLWINIQLQSVNHTDKSEWKTVFEWISAVMISVNDTALFK